MDNVIAFPTREPPEQEGMSLEDVVNIQFDTSKPDDVPFLDWVYVEVVDFQAYASELCTVAEQGGEEAFWTLVAQIRSQVNGWTP